jgi:hypothetical protein
VHWPTCMPLHARTGVVGRDSGDQSGWLYQL